MGPPSYVRSVVDRNVIMQCMIVISGNGSCSPGTPMYLWKHVACICMLCYQSYKCRNHWGDKHTTLIFNRGLAVSLWNREEAQNKEYKIDYLYKLGWRERNQQDAANPMFIIKLLSHRVTGIIMPIIRRTRPCTTAYGVVHSLCWLWLCGAVSWAVCTVWRLLFAWWCPKHVEIEVW